MRATFAERGAHTFAVLARFLCIVCSSSRRRRRLLLKGIVKHNKLSSRGCNHSFCEAAFSPSSSSSSSSFFSSSLP